MKGLLLAALLLGQAPLAAAQETVDCPACILGIWDDPGLSRNFGFWHVPATTFKEIFVGVRFEPGAATDGLTGIEFSIDGLPTLFIPPVMERPDGCQVCVGFDDIRTPPDTTFVGAKGGTYQAWDSCLPADVWLLRITLISFEPIGGDIVVRVRRRFPPSIPGTSSPLLRQCDAPNYTPTRVGGGCYVLNPSRGPGQSVGDCLLEERTAVTPSTWSRIKRLYR